MPTRVHFADYLKGGFDKEYPDHLPPRPTFGSAAEFRRFFDRCHALGHLIMPYTNPTWWCDHPRGPTFQRAGEAPLLRTLDGADPIAVRTTDGVAAFRLPLRRGRQRVAGDSHPPKPVAAGAVRYLWHAAVR